MERAYLLLNNPAGLNDRTAGILVKEASKYISRLLIKNGNKQADPKKIMGVFALGANQGDLLEIIAEGPDEIDALKGLESLIDSNFK